MDRETAIREIRERWREIIIHFTEQAKKAVEGKITYICPKCGHGKGGDGLKDNPKSKDGNGLKCFGCGWAGDILDLIMETENATFSEAVQTAAEIIGITIDPYTGNNLDYRNLTLDDNSRRPQKATGGPQRADRKKDDKTPGKEEKGREKANRNDERVWRYLTKTKFNLYEERKKDNSVAVAYLKNRGLNKIAVSDPWDLLGYDPAADPANAPFPREGDPIPHPRPRIIIQCGSSYVARAIEPNINPAYKMMNPKGYEIEIFCDHVIKQGGVIYVVEGAFDALSFYECGVNAIALNSKGNGKKLLQAVKQCAPDQADTRFIICHDNDPNPKTAADTMKRAEELKDGLQKLGYVSIVYNVAGECHDANDALINDRDGFETRIYESMEAVTAAAEEKKKLDALEEKNINESLENENPADEKTGEPLPGLLTCEDAIEEFLNADDSYIKIRRFQQFSKTVRIKKHSSVVLAADTGAGKSSLAINFLNGLNDEYPCLYINLEMDRLTVLRRLVAMYTGMELDRIEGYRNDERTADAVNIALKNIAGRKPLQIVQGAYMLEDIKDIIEKSTAGREETTIVFIDHSLLVDTKKNTAGRYDRFTRVSEGLRKIALEYNIILFVLLQQNRSGKAEEEEAPKNSSLKESGSWENDATHICFLWWDPAIKRKKLLITKNRNGEQGQFVLDYWKKTQTYCESSNQASKEIIIKSNKTSKRDKQRERLQQAFEGAYIETKGHPTVKAMADFADVTTATIKRWIKEHGGCTIDGEQVDPAGIDSEVDYTGFIKLTPADDGPFDDQEPARTPVGNGQKITKRF